MRQVGSRARLLLGIVAGMLTLAACGGAPAPHSAEGEHDEAPVDLGFTADDIRDLQVRVLALEVEVIDLRAKLNEERGVSTSIETPGAEPPDESTDDTVAEPMPYWTYDVAERWGELAPEYEACGSGAEQSPIDLVAAEPADLANVELGYEISLASIVDDGRTLRIAADDAGHIELDGTRYDFVEATFHAPSEHTVDGFPWPLEVQVVHESAEGDLAVIAVLVEQGDRSSAFDGIVRSLPDAADVAVEVAGGLDLRSMLPENLAAYRYRGSLTMPPCTEGVAWSVLQSTVTMSDEQLDAIVGRFDGPTNRPTQPLNDRVVEFDDSAG
jgi:carbonic anhydrase